MNKLVYLFDLQKELPPSSIEKQELMLYVTCHCFITSLNQKVPCIIHSSMLVHPVRKITKKLLEEKKRMRMYYKHSPTSYFPIQYEDVIPVWCSRVV